MSHSQPALSLAEDPSEQRHAPTGPQPLAASDDALRVQLSPTVGEGPLDGAWWPHSRDLAVEAAQLVDEFPESYDRICRVLYSTPDWEPPPRRLRAKRGMVNFGSFRHDDTHLVVLGSVAAVYRPRPLLLLVVPPETSDAMAAEAMRLASLPSNPDSASTILRNLAPQPAHVI